MIESPARVRFAPSPTGRFHIGGARTALYDYLIARQSGGQFILRIEDTDIKRYVEGAEQEIMDSLRWLGLEWDEGPDCGGPHGPYRQSERMDIYRELTDELIAAGHAYPCFCSAQRLREMREGQKRRKEPPHYDGLCRVLSPTETLQRIEAGETYVVRFKTPREGTTTAMDELRGPITVENSSIDDYILVKSNSMPVYHLAAMADDHLMEISHVLRSSEWLPTFPLHVLIYQAFGWEQPKWVHPSVFLNPSGKGKMSKRQAGGDQSGVYAIYTQELRELGYLPEAVNNWLALMGWSFDDHTEFFSLAELVDAFSIQKMNPAAAAVNFSKLDHFNGNYIRSLSRDDLNRRLLPFFEKDGLQVKEEQLRPITPLLQERIRTLDEAVPMARFFFEEQPKPNPEELIGKGMTAEGSWEALARSLDFLETLETFDPQEMEASLRALADEMSLKAGQLFGILRIAITGQTVSPPLIETMEILGREEVLQRLAASRDILRPAA